MSTTPPTLALFGATGGCTSALLVHALRSSHHTISALARTPSKLTSQLLAQGIPQSTLSSRLLITPGSATSLADVKSCLTAGQPTPNNTVAPIIVSGLGGTPVFQWSVREPVALDNPTICQDAARVLVQALQELGVDRLPTAEQKPLFAFISTTGISKPRGPEDVPWLFRPLYHWGLAVPHRDKRVAEDIFRGAAAAEGGKDGGVFVGVVGVRPSLLMGTNDVQDRKGLEKVREGREQEPAVGYTIRRADVGEWIFREVVEKKGEGWRGEMVTLTY
ncbi:MAG: hypothetical protein Q9227_001483 [Pyrenula ochraceoflavens]